MFIRTLYFETNVCLLFIFWFNVREYEQNFMGRVSAMSRILLSEKQLNIKIYKIH